MLPIKDANFEMGESGNIDQNVPTGVSTYLYGGKFLKKISDTAPYNHAYLLRSG